MHLQHQQSWVPVADSPFLEGTPVDASSSQHRGVLQERSANQAYEYHSDTTPSQLKQSCSPILTENTYAQRSVAAGTYYTGNVHAQHIGLAPFGIERPEKQIRLELERLYKMLQRSDKYQKYREKQPVMTPAEVIVKDAAERKEKTRRVAEGIPQDRKDNTVWPEFLEHAFWKALVRWIPMGRKKHMLEGALRGRNELIQDSIYRDTGINRDRKQVSSHLQVLKDKLKGFPAVLVYMATPGGDGKRNRANASSHANQSSYLRSRQPTQRTAVSSKYEYDTSSPHLWQQFAPQSDPTLGTAFDSESSSSPFTIMGFSMVVGDDDQPVHCFSRLHANGRLDDLNVANMNSWRRQHYEFDFLGSQPDEWRRNNRKVLVCDAIIKVMTESRPNASLHINFNLQSYVDLSTFKSLECTTRFFDSGNMTPDPQFDNTKHPDLKEHRTPCTYAPDPHGESGQLMIKFGSRFWVSRMARYQQLRHKDEKIVRDSLLRLTATQDVYGIKPGGGAQCIFTILWRFQQTRNSAEVGTMKWRSVNFASCRPTEQQWIQQQEYRIANNARLRVLRETEDMDDMDDMEVGHEEAMDDPVSAPEDLSLYHQASHLLLDFAHPHSTHHSYEVQPHHQPPPLALDILASMQPDLVNGSAPTTATDFSHQSFALSRTQDTGVVPSQHAHNNNNFDFNGGHITISGAFEPAINLSAYDTFATQDTGLGGLHALADDGFAGLGLGVGENGELVAVGTENDLQDHCYSTKPNWQHANLISQLENAAEQYHAYLPHDNHRSQATQGHEVLHGPDIYQQVSQSQGDDLVGHGLHDPHVGVGHGLWSLASPFHEDTSSGAVNGVDCRKEQAHKLGFGVLDLIERDARARGY